MKYLESFSKINSKVKKVTYKKHSEIKISFENGKKIKIIPVGDCCSISYITKIKGFPFSKLVGKKIKSLKEINLPLTLLKNKKNTNSLFTPITFSDMNHEVNKYHLYEIKFTDNGLFNFGLINASNGYYDGWIEILII